MIRYTHFALLLVILGSFFLISNNSLVGYGMAGMCYFAAILMLIMHKSMRETKEFKPYEDRN